jgi:TMEM151 family
VSSVIQGLDKSALTRIHFSKSFVFFTATAAKEFEEQRKSFFRDYQTRDDYMEMREGMDLMDIDFPDHVIVVRDLDGVPWWRRKWTFILAVLFLQAAPLRIFLALRTATLHYNVLKVFGMDERESNWVLPGETFGEELLPPSYSEIMLGESLAPTTAAIRPRDFGRFLLQKTGILVKSATSGFAESSSGRENEKAGHSELSGGVRARGLTTPGLDPISPAVELRTAREFTEILRRNGPKMFEGRMKRSNTAPVLSVVERGMRETVVRCTKPSCSWVNSLGSPV